MPHFCTFVDMKQKSQLHHAQNHLHNPQMLTHQQAMVKPFLNVPFYTLSYTLTLPIRLQVQQIWVEAVPQNTSNVKPFAVRASPLLVHLSEEDLCATVSIGHVVNIVGQATYISENGKSDAKLLGDVQVCISILACICYVCDVRKAGLCMHCLYVEGVGLVVVILSLQQGASTPQMYVAAFNSV